MKSHFTHFKLFILTMSTILVCSLSSCTNEDYDLFSTIKGNIVDTETAEPIANASVMLIPGNQTTKTDEMGIFQFSDLDSGQYTLSVQKSGYQANRKIVNAISGESVSVFIELEKIPIE